ncbi:MAG: SpoIIE family protein phosphatase [Streptosporangiales bacterium]|nr:SpoIIE family protein phosphatase [Streptosporangiales bacterium]
MDDLAARRDALRQAATAPDADPMALLDAALTELDGAVAAIGDGAGAPGRSVPETVRAERVLLRAAFQQVPAALFLLAADGTIRRASDRAVMLLGARTGYATGKSLTVFIDPSQRAAVQTRLAAVARTGQAGSVRCRVLAPKGTVEVTLAVTALELPGESPVLVASLGPGAEAPAQDAPLPPPEPDNVQGLATLTRRLDTVVALTRLLLDNATFNEAVTVQRCARLLAGEFADWIIVDLARDGSLKRQVVAGPRGPEPDASAARLARAVDPGPGTLPDQVHQTRKTVLFPHVDDPAALGATGDGTPLLMALRATSLLVVPVADGNVSYGVLTLARSASSGSFTLAEQALAEDLAGHLAVSLRVDKVFRRRSETAETLQASLLPERLPEVHGLDLASATINATRWQEASGDFYDVFRTPHGWAVSIGDVSGIGQTAAAMTAAARHSIRALAHVHDDDPARALAASSGVLLAGDYGERFVTAMLGFAEERDGGYRLRLANAGHPGPAIVRADGRVEIASGAALPLGLLPDEDGPDSSVLDVRPGDLLFFYTNGVTQACTDEWEYFEDRLADALAATAGGSASEAVRAVTRQLSHFCRDDFRDDVTMLAMRVR